MSMKYLAFVAGLVMAGAAMAQPAGPEVSSAWARATAPGAQDGVAYLTIQSPTADRLVSASTLTRESVSAARCSRRAFTHSSCETDSRR